MLPLGGLMRKKKKEKDIKNESEKENHNDLNQPDLTTAKGANESSVLESSINDSKIDSKKDKEAKKKDKKADKTPEKSEKPEKAKKEKLKVSELLMHLSHKPRHASAFVRVFAAQFFTVIAYFKIITERN